ncbi:restriction endonuclease subunit S [Aliivibrio salmonicida]|uniref:restriction endonuclease subunit S n=1 Tax=Aliivibrio salmonicida TaxID=40269 RepID=UPI00406D14C0
MIKLGCNESLPFGWKWVEAGSVIDVRDGTHDSPKPVEKGIPLITSKNLKNGLIEFSTCSFISEEDHINIGKRSAVENGDILYAMIGTIGSPVIVNTTQAFSIKNVALFKFNKPDVYNRFFYHFLNSSLVKQQFDKNARGGTQKFVSLGNIRALQIPLPPLEEQKRIAAILDKADAIRQKRKQAIELVDEFLHSVFLDMFGDPVSNPKGWEVKPLSEFSKIVTGNTPSRKDTDNYGDHIEWIKSDNINTPSHFLTEATESLSKKGVVKGRVVEEGSVLMTCIAGSLSCIGNIALANRNVAFNQQINAVVPTEKSMSEFLYGLMLVSKKQIQDHSTNSMKGMISKGVLSGINFPIPPIEEQKKYAHIFQSYINFLGNVDKHAVASVNMFNALSQKAFSGQL